MTLPKEMKDNYCYWSVATGRYGAMMERCVSTARAAGVFKEFHVLTDRPLEGCECYDAYECDKALGLFKLHYLKVGMNRLPFDYFIWIDADTVFVRNPVDMLGVLGHSPIHVPLELDLVAMTSDAEWKGISCLKLRELYEEAGILNRSYLCQSAFWIVRRDAIETVYELAFQFVNLAKEKGIAVNVDAALGYAMQLLCADPESHLLTKHPEVWASDDLGKMGGAVSAGGAWLWRHPFAGDAVPIRPAIVHATKAVNTQ